MIDLLLSLCAFAFGWLYHRASAKSRSSETETPTIIQSLEEWWHKKHHLLVEEMHSFELSQKRVALREVDLNLLEIRLKEQIASMEEREKRLHNETALLQDREKKLTETLESLTGKREQELLALLQARVEAKAKALVETRLKKAEREAQDHGQEIAQRHLLTALQRISRPVSTQITTSSILLPREDYKRRLVGRDGRNIRIFEKVTGVNLLIDDAPMSITLSSFDPKRRYLAQKTLQALIEDGRIYPLRIEEEYRRTEKNLLKQLEEEGREAASEVGMVGISSSLALAIGRMKLLQAQGQNLLDHAVEVSEIMGGLAAEMGLDERLARRIGLLHDIGKVFPTNQGGSHALCGMRFLSKENESRKVVHGVGAHHDEISQESLEGALCPIANRLSKERVGAASTTIDSYYDRLLKLEEMARKITGVEEAYALHAGREIYLLLSSNIVEEEEVEKIGRAIRDMIHSLDHQPTMITIVQEKRRQLKLSR